MSKTWIQQIEWHVTATNLSAKSGEVQVAIFVTIIRPDAAVLFDPFKLTDQERK